MSAAYRFFENGPLRDEAGAPVPRVGDRLHGVEFAKHEDRAREALARHVCSTRLTDGFCDPRGKAGCRCWTEARGLLQSMESVGVSPVWLYQIERPSASSPPVEPQQDSRSPK